MNTYYSGVFHGLSY